MPLATWAATSSTYSCRAACVSTEELAPHAKGVDIALAAFGVGKGSAKMAEEEVRKIEITYPTAFAAAAKAGGARVLAMMTAAGMRSSGLRKAEAPGLRR